MEEMPPVFMHGATEETTLCLWWSAVSPGSMSVVLLLNAALLPYKSFELTGLGEEEQNRTDPRYVKLNPDRTVPTLVDDGFTLTTPNAILRYIVQSRELDDRFFSKDLKKRSKINSAMDWSLFVLRKAGRDLLLSIEANRSRLVDDYWGTNSGPGGAHSGKPNGLMSAIARLETLWLARRDYAASRRRLSIADFCLFADFTFLYNTFHLELMVTAEKYPRLFAWQERVRQHLAADPELQKFDNAIRQRAKGVPLPPPCPPNLDLPWKDYK